MLGKASDRCLAFVDLLCSSFPFESFESCPAVRLCMLWRVLTGILKCFPIMSQIIHSSNPGRLCSAALLFFFQGEGKSASRELHVQEPSAASSMARRFRGFGGHARWSSMIQSNMSNMSNMSNRNYRNSVNIQHETALWHVLWHSLTLYSCSYLFIFVQGVYLVFISVYLCVYLWFSSWIRSGASLGRGFGRVAGEASRAAWRHGAAAVESVESVESMEPWPIGL